MRDEEAEELVAVVAARYPRAAWGENPGATLRAWAWTLADVPYEAAMVVAQRWFRVRPFPPDPAEIRSEVLTVNGLVPDADAAWKLARDRGRAWTPGQGWLNGEPAPAPEPVMATIAAIGGINRIAAGTIDREAFQKAYVTYRDRYMAQLNVEAMLADRLEPPAIEAEVNGN